MKLAILCLAAALAYGFQQPPEGKAKSCKSTGAHPCACGRAMECPKDGESIAEPGPHCKTFCRPQVCFCKMHCGPIS
jgi:hypothetical protein